MDSNIVANYLTTLKEKSGLTYEVIAEKSQREAHIENIRSHYKQHLQDIKDNYEKRLTDKREINTQQEEHIKSLKKERKVTLSFALTAVCVLVTILILEVLNPNLGWIRF